MILSSGGWNWRGDRASFVPAPKHANRPGIRRAASPTPCAPATARAPAREITRSLGSFRPGRVEGRALPDCGIDPGATAAGLDHLAHQRQADAGAVDLVARL